MSSHRHQASEDRARQGVDRLRSAVESANPEAALRDFFQEMMPPGVRLVDRGDFERSRRKFYSVMRNAARAHVARGWEVRTSRLVLRAPSGHWGQIAFKAEQHASPLPVVLFAGALSPYLMRVWNGLDPDRLPDLTFHAGLHWQTLFSFANEDRDRPRPLDIRKRKRWEAVDWPTGIVLGPNTAEAWLRDLIDGLAASIEGLMSDQAIHDWLLANEPDNYWSLRDAALLSQHLGLTDVPDLVERARVALERVDAKLRNAGQEPYHPDRSRLYRQFWSHRRFVRHLAEIRAAEASATT
jgi:hypothetical protein